MNNKSDRQGDFFDEYHHDDSALVMNDGIEQPRWRALCPSTGTWHTS